MRRVEYFFRCGVLSDRFAQKLHAVDTFLLNSPDLNDDRLYGELNKLQDEALAAALEWREYCEQFKDLIQR